MESGKILSFNFQMDLRKCVGSAYVLLVLLSLLPSGSRIVWVIVGELLGVCVLVLGLSNYSIPDKEVFLSIMDPYPKVERDYCNMLSIKWVGRVCTALGFVLGLASFVVLVYPVSVWIFILLLGLDGVVFQLFGPGPWDA